MKKIFLFSMAMLAMVSCSDDDSGANIAPIDPPSEGIVFGTAENPLNLGGPNEQNQVYVDLSGESTHEAFREGWDLGFYSGDDFKVVINGSLAMAAKQLETTDITLPQEEDASVAVGTFQVENLNYVDNPNGSLDDTAFGTIAESEAEAKVYLINLGYSVPTATPDAGSVNTAGDLRGWRKVKVFKNNAGGYTLQYAKLSVTNYQEIEIAKNPEYNHTFFSFTANDVVLVEPAKAAWDMNFTTFTNEVFDNGGASAGAYFYSDFIVINNKAGVTAVAVAGDTAAYNEFTMETYTSANYVLSDDQRAIGANWRSVIPVEVYNNVFFLLKDAAGNMYKIRFISMLDTDGVRGFPVFEYQLL